MIPFLLLIAYCALFFPSIPMPLLYAQFVVGVAIGFLLIYADRLLHAVYLYPEAEFSLLLKEQLRRKSVAGVAQLLYQAEGLQSGLLTRSIMFLIAYLVLAVFVLTSTGSILGTGVILGIGLRYCWDMWKLRQTPEVFIREFLSGVRHSFTAQDIQRMVFVWLVGFVIVSVVVWI